MVESENTETKNPPNPSSHSSSSSCLTENTSLNGHAAIQESHLSDNFKKTEVSPFSWKGRDTREWVVYLMSSMQGAQDPSLIFEKTLSAIDVNPGQSRLLIPFNQLVRNDFLNPNESTIMEEDMDNSEDMGVGAVLVDQRTEKWGVILKKYSGNGRLSYGLVYGWNDIVKANGLKDGDNISLWSFRCRGILCFALVPLLM